LKFAVHRPGIPEASPRSHGVPRRDVPGRVHISVTSETTDGAQEARLALARPPVHLPARRAALARERGFDLLHPAGRLVFQAAHQKAPARPQDAPVESGLDPDVPTRVLGGPLSRSRHVLDLEVFDPDHVEPAREIRRDLLGPILSPVGLAGAQPGDGQPYPLAAFRSPLSAGELALQAPHATLFARGQAGNVQHLPGGQGRGYRHAPIDANHLAVSRCGDRSGDRGEGDVPPACAVHGHPVGLHPRRHRAGPPEPDPSDLRDPDLADVAGHTAHVPLRSAPGDAESLVPVGFAPRRPPCRVLRVEEGLQRLGEVAQCLLLHRLAARAQPDELRAGLGELQALLQVARGARAARVPVRVLLDGQVPHVPGLRAVVPQRRLLGGRGEQPVPGHTNILASTTHISGEVKRRFLHGLIAGVSTSRYW
jgi:hypothetical protein